MFEPPIKKIKLSETEKKFENQVSLCRPIKQQCGNSADVACSKPEETACEISVSLEYLVDDCMHEEEHILKAVDILSSVPFQYPPSNILKFLLEKLSEENLKDNVKSAIFTYLSRLILVYPPSDHTHSYYFMAMCKPHICWWEFIHKIIQTSTQEPERSDDQQLSSIKGCRIFLKILVEIFTKDFENSKEVNSMDLVYDRRKPFIALLFFIPGLENVRVKMLLFSIEGLICISPNDEKLEMLSILMQILKLIADCALVKAANHEILALHKPNLGVLVKLIFNHCREIFKNFEKFKIFLSFLSPKWLKVKVLEDQIQKFCLKSNSGKSSYIPLTLRKIVRRYMFPPLITFSEPEKDNIPGKSKLSTSYVNSRNNKGENRLHRACISKKPESLKELLISGADINARDYAGWTPLHESCYRGNYECSSILMKWFPANLSLVTVSAEYLTSVDISASNNGVTPFHEAVLSGNVDLVRLFLQFGGLSLNRIRDEGGSKPLDYASSEMLEAVKKTPKRASQFDQNYFNFDGDLSYQSRICVQLQDCALYEKYLYLLFLMLNEYMDLTTLRDLRNFFCQQRRSCSDKLQDILKHFVELHDLSFDMENCAFLMDDLFVLQSFPIILKTFKKQVMEHVSSENNVLAHLSSLELLCYSL